MRVGNDGKRRAVRIKTLHAAHGDGREGKLRTLEGRQPVVDAQVPALRRISMPNCVHGFIDDAHKALGARAPTTAEQRLELDLDERRVLERSDRCVRRRHTRGS